ncbi:MAG: hypothetical protein ACK4F9_05010, partial [Brevinematia bacterium]
SQKSFSIMPDEVGIQDIVVETKTSEPSQEILGIGFGEPKEAEKTTEKISELTSEEFSESLSISEPEEVSEVSFSEVISEKGLFEETPYEEIEETIQEKTTKVEKAIESLSEQEKEDIRKVLLYLDKLLENLPDDKIKEFASSEYYDIYVKLFDKLNLK